MLSRIDAKTKTNFGRALTTEEKSDFIKIAQTAKEKIGPEGKSILIVHDACLPQNTLNNTGVGHLASAESGQFLGLMKAYLGINTVEVLPPGQIKPYNGFHCAYSSTALSLGDHQINPELLTKPEFGEILKKDEFDEIVKTNVATDKNTIVNFENVVGDNSPHNIALQKAFDRFESSSVPKVAELKKQFDDYKTQNNDWLEPKSLFEVLRKEHGNDDYDSWPNEVDKNLYNSEFDQAKSKERINELAGKNKKEIEFYKFKQFIADEHLKLGKQDLNQKGLKLFGDCLIGFSKDETWAYPKAFEKDAKIGLTEWGLPALDYSTIKNENSDSAKLLKRKVGLFAKRYDSIRFDVSWAYVDPVITPKGASKYGAPRHQGGAVLDIIEKTVKEVKGKDFDLKDLIHEFEAGEEEFKPFNGKDLIEPLKTRTKVFGSTYMSEDWGSNDAFLKRGFGADGFVIGPGNHDPISLRQLAEAESSSDSGLKAQKEAQIKPLADILKLDAATLKNPVEFTKAKFAEPIMAKNNMVFYMDVFGRKERFDLQNQNVKNYRYKIADSFESDYHKAVQEGHGFNLMDSFEKVFKAKELDKKHPELYKSIVLFRDTLQEKGVTTEKEANETVKNPIKPIIQIKNSSKFLKPFLIAGSAIAVIGGGLFFYKKKQERKIHDDSFQVSNSQRTTENSKN